MAGSAGSARRARASCFSRAPPPRRGQQNLLGFMQMSSGRRFSLEQLMVESGRLELETGQPDPVSGGAAAAAVGGDAAAAAAAAPAPMGHFKIQKNSETWA